MSLLNTRNTHACWCDRTQTGVLRQRRTGRMVGLRTAPDDRDGFFSSREAVWHYQDAFPPQTAGKSARKVGP